MADTITPFGVDAFDHSTILGSTGSGNFGQGLLTGFIFAAGDDFTVEVDPLDTWLLNAQDGALEVNADGGFRNFTFEGQTFLFGTLVGKIGSSDFISLGTNFSGAAPEAGELRLFFWDSNNVDNSGFVTADVGVSTTVALLASAPLIRGAFGLLAAFKLRRKPV